MSRAVIWLLILTVACREGRSGVPETSPPNVALRSDSAWPEDGEPGVEFEAPRMIPAARAQLTELDAEFAGLGREDRYAGPLAVDLELVDRVGSLQVRGHEERGLALLLEPDRELGGEPPGRGDRHRVLP